MVGAMQIYINVCCAFALIATSFATGEEQLDTEFRANATLVADSRISVSNTKESSDNLIYKTDQILS